MADNHSYNNIISFCIHNGIDIYSNPIIRIYFENLLRSNIFLNQNTNPFSNPFLIQQAEIKYDNSSMETDTDSYLFLEYDGISINLFIKFQRGNLKMNYIRFSNSVYSNDIIRYILYFFQNIFPNIKINSKLEVREVFGKEIKMNIIHYFFYLLDSINIINCFGVKKEIRKTLKFSEKMNDHCSCCNSYVGDISIHGKNIDHIRELQYFGTNNLDNFQILCLDCHNYKTIINRNIGKKMTIQSNADNVDNADEMIGL